MSKSAILKSSIAKKWWMALTGLFLCLFLVGHLLGNLQLIFITGEDGRRAFNEYAFFMTHNPFIKILSYVTYASILFHAIDGILLTVQNKKARPIAYTYNKPGASSSTPSRYMAILGSAILIFIVLHMSSFWGKMHFSEMPLHKVSLEGQNGTDQEYFVMNAKSSYVPLQSYLAVEVLEKQEGQDEPSMKLIDGTIFKATEGEAYFGEGFKDLHSITMAFFGHDKTKEAGQPANEYALIAVLLYVLSMIVLSFHLWHGFASAFQSLGMKNEKYTPLISGFGKVFSVVVPLLFAVIPVVIFLTK